MKKTLSFHNGTKTNREHNIRNPKTTGMQPHIDKELSKYNEILYDEPPRQAYERVFGKALEDYNSKQKYDNNKIKSYYNYVNKDEKRHVLYEVIVQIGDRNSTGVDYEKTLAERECLREYYEGWNNRNPNLYCTCAVIHADESDGTIHIHLQYFPYSGGYKRGLETQNGLVRALGMQGFKKIKNLTAQIQWQFSERKVLTDICRKHGIEIEEVSKEKRAHMEKEEYIQYSKIKENDRKIQEGEEIIGNIREKILKGRDIVKELSGEIKDAEEIKQMTLGTNIFGRPNKEVKLSYKEYIDLKATAERVNEIDDIKEREIEENEQYYSKKIAHKDKLIELYDKNIEELEYKEERYKDKIEYKDDKINELERTLEDIEFKISDISDELRKEKLYAKSMEEFLYSLERDGRNLFDEFLDEQERKGKMNRKQRRARERGKNKEDYENYYNDDPRYY